MRDRIQKKAEELFRKYGIRSITMDEIARQLGISKKTIYQYYDDKDALVAATITAMLDYHKDCCASHRCECQNPVEEIYSGIEMLRELKGSFNPAVIFDLVRYHPKVYKKIIHFKHQFLFTAIRSNLEKGKELGLYRDDIDVDVLSTFRVETLMMGFNEEIFPENGSKFQHIAQCLSEHFLHGIVSPAGLKILNKYKLERQNKTNA